MKLYYILFPWKQPGGLNTKGKVIYGAGIASVVASIIGIITIPFAAIGGLVMLYVGVYRSSFGKVYRATERDFKRGYQSGLDVHETVQRQKAKGSEFYEYAYQRRQSPRKPV